MAKNYIADKKTLDEVKTDVAEVKTDVASVKSDVTGIGGKVEAVGKAVGKKLYVGTSAYACTTEGVYRARAYCAYSSSDSHIHFREGRKLYSLRIKSSSSYFVRVYDSTNYSSKEYSFTGVSGSNYGCCAVIGNILYAFVSYNDENGSIYKCDFTTNTGIKVADLPYKNAKDIRNRCFVYNNKIYIAGNGIYEFNPSNNTMVQKSTVSTISTTNNGVFLYGSNIYILYRLTDSYIYNITTNTLKRITLPENFVDFSCTAFAGGHIYYLAAHSGASGSYRALYRSNLDFTGYRAMKDLPGDGVNIMVSFDDDKLHLITINSLWYEAKLEDLVAGRSKIYLKAGNKVYTDGTLSDSTETILSSNTAPSEGVYYLDDYSYYTVE